MASIAQSLPGTNRSLGWLWEWLRDELSPYPGRALLVARMVTAATLVIIIGMTFQIPYIWQGAIYALLVSRESPRATVSSAATILFVTGIGAAYLILSMKLVINSPALHFYWIIATLFISFFAISTLTNYLAAVAFVNTISLGIPLWDRHVSAETNVEDTLWLCLAVLIAVVVTGAIELAYLRHRHGDEAVSLMMDRLSSVEGVLGAFAEGRAPDPAAAQKLVRFAMLGTSTMRRILARSDVPPEYAAVAGGVVVLIGRLVDLAATLTPLSFEFSAMSRQRFGNLASALAGVRHALRNREIPAAIHFPTEGESAAPLLAELEQTVTLMTDVFTGTRSADEYPPTPDAPGRPMLLSRDAFINPDHVRFALKGCLAASLCYVIYNAVAWPGISTAVTTCLLTALSTIGASRQKQMLRITGAIAGGFVLGMGSQIFILPYIDSIGGFVVLFAAVTALSSWILTSSPRLSYFGVQAALAFCLVNAQEFKIQTSLGVARDRVVGILLGLFMMWFIFDQVWSSPASIQMKRTLISSFRLVAQFAREPLSSDLKIALGRTLALRDTINANLDNVRALADGVLFEFGPSRQRDLELRAYIRQWQPHLRTLFVMRIASLKYRLQLPGFELPESVFLAQQAYDEHSARLLDEMADRIDGKAVPELSEDTQELLNKTIDALRDQNLPAGRAQSFMTLLSGIDKLTSCLVSEVSRGNW